MPSVVIETKSNADIKKIQALAIELGLKSYSYPVDAKKMEARRKLAEIAKKNKRRGASMKLINSVVKEVRSERYASVNGKGNR